MIQSILVYILGFLTAALLALMAVPALWRRAVRLTRERVIASVPLTMNEIEAEKDRMRAAFAMEVRQIEMKLERTRERAARLMIDSSQANEKARAVAEQAGSHAQLVARLEGELASARGEARKFEEALHVANDAIGRLEADANRVVSENAEIAGQHDEISLKLGSLEIELANRDGEIARLNEEIRASRDSGMKAAGRRREAQSGLKAAEASLRLEQRRFSELEKKYEKAMARLSERDVAIERLKRETLSLRAAKKDGGKAANNVLNLDVARLSADNTALREQVLDLAAKVVALTAAEEGESSPINAALEAAGSNGAATSGLADRIRALRKSASSGRN